MNEAVDCWPEVDIAASPRSDAVYRIVNRTEHDKTVSPCTLHVCTSPGVHVVVSFCSSTILLGVPRSPVASTHACTSPSSRTWQHLGNFEPRRAWDVNEVTWLRNTPGWVSPCLVSLRILRVSSLSIDLPAISPNKRKTIPTELVASRDDVRRGSASRNRLLDSHPRCIIQHHPCQL